MEKMKTFIKVALCQLSKKFEKHFFFVIVKDKWELLFWINKGEQRKEIDQNDIYH